MLRDFDHILLIGFGGPEKPEDIRPFLEIAARGRAIPEPRLREVEHHYEQIGGYSPYNENVFGLAEQLKKTLEQERIALPIFIGMRNWKPFLKETLDEIRSRKLRKGVGIVLAPHRSEASYGRYIEAVQQAKQSLAFENHECIYLKPWFDHPLFILAQAEQIRRGLEQIPGNPKGCHILFSAHSIPLEMANRCHYAEEFRKSCELVAQELNYLNWSLAYQSRSVSPQRKQGAPSSPWLGPDICEQIRQLKSRGIENVLAVPLGFLCDNAEILYDLDIEAKAEAAKSGTPYFRASTAAGHPKFVEMLNGLIQEQIVGELKAGEKNAPLLADQKRA